MTEIFRIIGKNDIHFDAGPTGNYLFTQGRPPRKLSTILTRQEVLAVLPRLPLGVRPMALKHGLSIITMELNIHGTDDADMEAKEHALIETLVETDVFFSNGGTMGTKAELQIKSDGASEVSFKSIFYGVVDELDARDVLGAVIKSHSLYGLRLTLYCEAYWRPSLAIELGPNEIKTPSFEEDGNSDGLADNWAKYLPGTVTAMESTIVLHGCKSQKITTDAAWEGIESANMVAPAGTTEAVAYAWVCRPAAGSDIQVILNDTTGVYRDTQLLSTGGWQTKVVGGNTWHRIVVSSNAIVAGNNHSLVIAALTNTPTVFYVDKTFWKWGETEEILGEGVILHNPYLPMANQYKGQLHCSSTNSDGADTPVALETAYLNAGYDFVAITDHDFLTPDPGVGGILHIDGVEETATEGHILSIDPNNQKAPGPAQGIIDAILTDGGIPVMAHPNFVNGWTDAELESIIGYFAIEVYNDIGAPGSEAEAENRWDTLLSKGRKAWGIAGDDCHNIAGGNFDKGWVVVFADSLAIADIVAALKAGNFYSSTGPTLSISLSGETITVVTDSSSTIDWIGEGGEILRRTTGATTDSFTVEGLRYYVRVRIIRDSDGKKAWSNPFYIINRGNEWIGHYTVWNHYDAACNSEGDHINYLDVDDLKGDVDCRLRIEMESLYDNTYGTSELTAARRTDPCLPCKFGHFLDASDATTQTRWGDHGDVVRSDCEVVSNSAADEDGHVIWDLISAPAVGLGLDPTCQKGRVRALGAVFVTYDGVADTNIKFKAATGLTAIEQESAWLQPLVADTWHWLDFGVFEVTGQFWGDELPSTLFWRVDYLKDADDLVELDFLLLLPEDESILKILLSNVYLGTNSDAVWDNTFDFTLAIKRIDSGAAFVRHVPVHAEPLALRPEEQNRLIFAIGHYISAGLHKGCLVHEDNNEHMRVSLKYLPQFVSPLE